MKRTPVTILGRIPVTFLTGFLFFGGIPFLQANLIINEILAISTGASLPDEDGFPSDWIEIHNTGSSPVPLGGYSLTDNPLNPTKWTFPDLTIPAGGYFGVFASGKDRKTNPSFLHTNFSLDGDGEYLALIAPDGFTVVDHFSPSYPRQFKDVSYGLGSEPPFFETTLLPLGAPLTYLVPSEEIGDGWKMPGFDDSSWTESASAVGFDYASSLPDYYDFNVISPNGDVGSVMYQRNSSIYLRFPFDIVDPAGVGSLRLKVKVDDGFVAFINGVEVTSFNRPAGDLTYNSTASAQSPGAEVETFEQFEYQTFDLPVDNLVAGENILAVQGLNWASANRDFIFISELEADIQDLTQAPPLGYFTSPSPGLPNGPPVLDPPSEVIFDSTSRAFTEDFVLSLSVPEPEAVIRYTTNGDPVTEESEIYQGPIEITGSEQIRARAFLPSALPGPSRTEGYVKIAASEADFSSDLPIVILSTFGEGSPPGTDSTTRKDVFMLIYEPDPLTGRATLDGTPVVTTRGGFRKRGSSSAGFPKYGMSLETWDENNDERDIDPFGFGGEGDWILNARYTFDLSLMRNALTYDISNKIGRWAVETQFVELFNDVSGSEVTSSDYFGVYTFMERIDTDNDRLDITDLDPWENSPEEITGGYIFKQDRSDPNEPPFSASGFGNLVYVEPDYDVATPEQRAYIRDYVNQVSIAVNAGEEEFSELLNLDSFIDNFWINILVMDPDWGRLSQFYFKDRGGKLSAGPAWDYDRTMGSRDGRDDNPRRWAGPGDSSLPFYDSRYPIWGRLFGFNSSHSSSTLPNPQLQTSRPDVFQKLIDRWYELRGGGFSTEVINQSIARFAAELDEAQARNFARWNLNPGGITGIDFSESGLFGWDKEVSHLRGWLEARTEWIDEQFIPPPAFSQNGGVVNQNFQLSITGTEGSIYYTLDGSDPRAPGGSPSASAIAGSTPTLTETTTVTARAYTGQEWGAPTQATFVIGAQLATADNLVISEIMYDPAAPTTAEALAGFNADGFFEYLEILNTSSEPVDLNGVTFTDGIDFDFTGSDVTLLAPGGRVLVVRSTAAFTERYGNGFANLIAGEFANGTGLSGNGERLALTGLEGLIADVTYNNNPPWPTTPDGVGPSLVYLAGSTDPGLAQNWRPSVDSLGNPGTGDFVPFTGDPAADNDGDGLSAFSEYAYGTDDAIFNSPPLVGQVDLSGTYAFTFPRNLAADEAAIVLQVSTDLTTWNPATQVLGPAQEVHNGDGTMTYIFRTPDPAVNRLRLFGRLQVFQR